jgi:hypothetical protein
MKVTARFFACLGLVTIAWLLTTTAAMAADFVFRVPVNIKDPDPSWERVMVACTVSGPRRDTGSGYLPHVVAEGVVYFTLKSGRDYRGDQTVNANVVPRRTASEAQSWNCGIQVQLRGSAGYPPMSRVAHDTARSRTVVSGRF